MKLNMYNSICHVVYVRIIDGCFHSSDKFEIEMTGKVSHIRISDIISLTPMVHIEVWCNYIKIKWLHYECDVTIILYMCSNYLWGCHTNFAKKVPKWWHNINEKFLLRNLLWQCKTVKHITVGFFLYVLYITVNVSVLYYTKKLAHNWSEWLHCGMVNSVQIM